MDDLSFSVRELVQGDVTLIADYWSQADPAYPVSYTHLDVYKRQDRELIKYHDVRRASCRRVFGGTRLAARR